MGTPTSKELALQAEVQQLRERLALVEGSELEGRQVGEAGSIAAHEQAATHKNRLESVLEALPTGVALVDAQGGIIECNAAFEQAWGEPRPRSIEGYAAHKPRWADTGKPVRPEEWASARALQRGETVVNQEVWIERFDGTRALVLNSAAPIRDAHGRISGAAVGIRDVTKLKATEVALYKSEAQLASIYNTVRDVIFYLAVEPEGQFRFVSVNAAFLRVTGLTREAVIGKLVNDVIPQSSLTMVLENYRQAIEEKTAMSWEETSDYPTGRLTGVVTVAPVFDRNGTCMHLVGSVHDITRRKQAEAELRESEERFRTVADTAPVMIWMAGPDKLCIFFNKPWLEFTGRAMEQELGNGWANGVHPDDLDRCLKTYFSAFDARRNFQMEYRLRRADGEYRWLLDNGTPRYREGEFAGYIGSCIDITDKRLAEEQSRSNQAQLLDSQRLARVGSWELDVATGMTRWSDEWYRIFGLSRDVRAHFQTFLSCVHPRDQKTVLEAEKMAHSAAAPFEVEFRIIRAGGEVRSIRSIVEAIKNDEGALVRLTGAAQDITEQVNATERLRESEARLKNAEQLSKLGHWDWDLKTNRVLWSAGTYRILDRPRDYQPSFEDLLRMTVPEDRERVEQVVRASLAQNRGFAIEFQIARPNGDRRTVRSVSEGPLTDEEGLLFRMFGTVQDITEEKRAHEELFGRQKLETLATLAGGVAHDFNNLMGSALAQAELGLGELEDGLSPEEELQAIRTVAMRGSEIVRQLMVYTGKESAAVEPLDLSTIVKEMLDLLKVSVSKHVVIETVLGEDLLSVRANAAQLRQIVMNLVINASEAIGDRDGVIRVTTSCEPVDPSLPGATADSFGGCHHVC
jgi:PAS domain S-box-containing protein